MRNYQQTIDWYKTHRKAREIGFNPDGMCLKVCRRARDIGSRYGTAKQAQDATPQNHRVHRVADLRRGMVLYFDDPNDSNTAGHIVTMIGRVKGYDWNSLDDVLVETNSVQAGAIVVVRASYFGKHWGDKFQFGATWLNGLALDVPATQTQVVEFKKTAPSYDVKILDKAVKNGRQDLKKHIIAISKAVDGLPDDKKKTRVKSFKDYYKKHRVMKMWLLRKAVEDGRTGVVRGQLTKINAAIKALPER